MMPNNFIFIDSDTLGELVKAFEAFYEREELTAEDIMILNTVILRRLVSRIRRETGKPSVEILRSITEAILDDETCQP